MKDPEPELVNPLPKDSPGFVIDPVKLIRAANEAGERPSQAIVDDVVHGANEATKEIRALEHETNPHRLSPTEHHSATVAFVREIQRVGLMNVDPSFSAPFRRDSQPDPEGLNPNPQPETRG